MSVWTLHDGIITRIKTNPNGTEIPAKSDRTLQDKVTTNENVLSLRATVAHPGEAADEVDDGNASESSFDNASTRIGALEAFEVEDDEEEPKPETSKWGAKSTTADTGAVTTIVGRNLAEQLPSAQKQQDDSKVFVLTSIISAT